MKNTWGGGDGNDITAHGRAKAAAVIAHFRAHANLRGAEVSLERYSAA